MKLSRIYSNNAKFQAIDFLPGFNVIYGDVEASIDDDGTTHEHNLGKTSLIQLIDFMLLKKIQKGHLFSKHKAKFSDWVFYLEIELNDGGFVTVRRSVNPNSKIAFKKHSAKRLNLANDTQWDFEDLSLNTDSEEDKPVNILNNMLAFDVAEEFNYRKYLSYLLRDQNDYQDVFKLNKFRGSDGDWKPALFALLGFDPQMVENKYSLDAQVKDDSRYVQRLQSDSESDETYRLRAAVEAKTIERDDLQLKINSFDFYNKEQNLSYDLIKTIEKEVSELNSRAYTLRYKIDQAQNAIDKSSDSEIDIKDIEELFEEVKIYFPENLTKEYEDVLRFRTQLSSERNKYLASELKDSHEELKKTKIRLRELNGKRVDILSVLKEKNTFIKYQSYQQSLLKIQGEIAKFESQLDTAKMVNAHLESLSKTKDRLKVIVDELKQQILNSNPDYQDIKLKFNEVYHQIFNLTALLVVQLNKENNVDFEATVLNASNDATGKGDGFTSTKALCVAFVLAVIAHYSNKSFMRFAYHDGVLESWGNNPKTKFIELARDYCDIYGMQYIVTVIKSDIPPGFSFEQGEIRRTLKEDDTLFGFGF